MQVEIKRLGHKGDGISEDGIYVQGALPGETVEGTRDGDRLQDVKIVSPSADRVKPPCRHAKACGGCALQHASDDFVAQWKTEFVAKALEHHGIGAPMEPISTSPTQSRRRAVLHGRRTKKGVLLGLHARAADTLVSIPECQLMVPEIVAALPQLERLVELGGSRRGEMDIAVISTELGLDVAVTNGKELDLDLQFKLGAFMQESGLIRLSWNSESVAQITSPYLRFGHAKVVPTPGSFLQATEAGERFLVDMMKRAVEGSGRVIDLFSGCGTFSLPIAEFAEVHAVESVTEMLDALEKGWRLSEGLKKVTVETRDLYRQPIRVDELNRYDAAIIDPPRPGALAQCEEIAKSDLKTVGFVSCNPITFARDAKVLLDAGFLLEWVVPVDQFRWSTHVEIAACFKR
ncbi:class I SAM-dependent RNA methyltransferase [Celeribacter litoreus]|uniref:class I SAM-dependent RNA methyltransferase n=1 Tax=Celeribacter litoreus TaxID=2876714 RepID=UPI001CCDD779|nr:class I SAM-dependent RNA methyltransferase [Celeribacter litoreus]MCA0042119.1 class I SAM-dependent RNA methyltransferase [Celeribacter litoreus]